MRSGLWPKSSGMRGRQARSESKGAMGERRQWRLVPTEGSPCHVRICSRFAAVPVEDSPTEDLPASLSQVAGFGIARYATSKFAADIALTLEHRSGAVEMSRFG